ncbi:MAG: hypothetical protein ACREPL_03795 [Rhodanobacteraceae bacterium]
MAEVDHFRPLRLDDPTHDVDRGVVAVEQAAGGDETQRGGIGARLGDGKLGSWGTHVVCSTMNIF